jgi:hypothetical protein
VLEAIYFCEGILTNAGIRVDRWRDTTCKFNTIISYCATKKIEICVQIGAQEVNFIFICC